MQSANKKTIVFVEPCDAAIAVPTSIPEIDKGRVLSLAALSHALTLVTNKGLLFEFFYHLDKKQQKHLQNQYPLIAF